MDWRPSNLYAQQRMATLHPDFKEFLSSLIENDVRFVIVGAHALAAHGVQRYTADIDLLLEPTRQNAQRLAQVLERFGWPKLADVAEEHFAEPDRMARLGRSPVQIDLLTSVSGLTFGEAWTGRVETNIDGLDVAVLGLAEYVRTKRAAGRPKDRIDIELLREAGLLEDE